MNERLKSNDPPNPTALSLPLIIWFHSNWLLSSSGGLIRASQPLHRSRSPRLVALTLNRMPNKEIELKHAKVFLDLAFGVLIALPLFEILPRSVSGIRTEPSLSSWGSLLLLTAVVVFSAFYWVEVRRFIDEQSRFDRAIGAGGISLPKFLGSLIMVALATTSLQFTDIRRLRAFLITTLLFWFFDLFGNIGLKLRYKQEDVKSIEHKHPKEYEWYMTNIRPWYKGPFYSGINIGFFGSVLVVVYISHDLKIQFMIASLVFGFTLFRQLYLRTKL